MNHPFWDTPMTISIPIQKYSPLLRHSNVEEILEMREQVAKAGEIDQWLFSISFAVNGVSWLYIFWVSDGIEFHVDSQLIVLFAS